MAEDPKKLIAGLNPRGKEDKKGSMFYLPKALDREFRKVCGDGNSSRVVEVLIRNFLEDVSKNRKGKQ